MKQLRILVENGPGPESEFIEAENERKQSIGIGQWTQETENGRTFWVLTFDIADLVNAP